MSMRLIAEGVITFPFQPREIRVVYSVSTKFLRDLQTSQFFKKIELDTMHLAGACSETLKVFHIVT